MYTIVNFIVTFAHQIKKNMLQQLKQFKEKHPFTALMLIAIAVRIIAVAFVPGFGSHQELQHPSLIHDFLEWLKNAIGLSGSPKV